MIVFTAGFDLQLFDSIKNACGVANKGYLIRPDAGVVRILRDFTFDILTLTEVVHTTEAGNFETLEPIISAVRERNERTIQRNVAPLIITLVTDARLTPSEIARFGDEGIQQILPKTGFDVEQFVAERFPQGQPKEGGRRIGW